MKKFKPNLEYFKIPPSKLINNFKLSKYDFTSQELTSNTPSIYISQKTSDIDYNLIKKCITDKFVFFRDDVVTKISNNMIDEEEQTLILNEIKNLCDNNYSLSLVYGSSQTIFGENETISESLASFLNKTKLDIKFLSFPGEYFAFPIWSDKPRKSKIYASQQLTLKHRFLEGLNKKEITKTINQSIPSSASTYLTKYPLNIISNSLADGLERVLYCCPHCKELLSIYSEFSCIKCKNCGMVVELSPDGYILFSNNIKSFDDIENFQFKNLSKKGLTINALIQYDKITQIIYNNSKIKAKFDVILQIYAEKMIIINKITQKKTIIFYEDIENIEYSKNNMITIKTKNANLFCFYGNSNENFLIIKDLVKLNKN